MREKSNQMIDQNVSIDVNSNSPLSILPNDPRVEYIRKQIQNYYKNIKNEKIILFLDQEENVNKINHFLSVKESSLLLLYENAQNLILTSSIPKNMKICTNFLYFIKFKKDSINNETYKQDIIIGNLDKNILNHLSNTIRHIYLPLLSNPKNQFSWPEMLVNNIMESINNFLSNLQITIGQTKGKTCLPLPPESIRTSNAFEVSSISSSSNDHSSINIANEKIHILEGCLITWTKQIKNILRQDPETLVNQARQHPGPLCEIEFWKMKAQNLNSIFDQLQGDHIRKILRYLDQSKSTYNVPFAKLCKEVFVARAEANDNIKFLELLRPWFEKLSTFISNENDSVISNQFFDSTFYDITQYFRPIFYSILSIWKYSEYYNTPNRIIVLIREICNELIRQSCLFLNGSRIFNLIKNDEINRCIQLIKYILKVCAYLKTIYFDYKSKALLECPTNQWKIPNNGLFIRLDSFLERCHDILEFTQTILQFNKLSKIEVGGTKGKTLTTSVEQIYLDFMESIHLIKNVQYDIMDIDAVGFDETFYEFRSKIKELEKRLASIVSQGFDDCNSIIGRFKLFDTFDDLLERTVIKNELEKKHSILVTSYIEDLRFIQEEFIEKKTNPPIGYNLPPFSGALTWCRGLLERIQFTMDKLKKLNRTVLEREDCKEAIKNYTILVASLDEYEKDLINTWAQSIELSSQAKLKLPLLRKAYANEIELKINKLDPILSNLTIANNLISNSISNSNSNSIQFLYVNFDSALVRLLREVKYFLILHLDIPETALGIYKKAEIFRRQTGNLDLIVNMYNNIQSKLLNVERPLVKLYLEKMDQIIARGLRSLNWKSHGIDLFIKECMTDVNEVNSLLSCMKNNLQRIEELLKDWAKILLFERKSKPLPIDEFEEIQKLLLYSRYLIIKEGGIEIRNLLKDIIKQLKVSQGSADWRSYVDYINEIILNGLTNIIISSLEYLRDQLDNEKIEREDSIPMIEIDLDLVAKEIVFIPHVGSYGNIQNRMIQGNTNNNNNIEKIEKKNGLRDLIHSWIENVFKIATLFKRIDISEGSYIKDMRDNYNIRIILSKIYFNIQYNEIRCEAYRMEYKKYEYIWTTDLNLMFNEFLKTVWISSNDMTPIQVSTSTLLTASSISPPDDYSIMINLNLFQKKIDYFLSLQNEISDIKHTKDICFMRINSQPVKQALSTWVTKWIYMFTQFLYDRVLNKLTWLDNFMNDSNIGLQEEINNSLSNNSKDKDNLMKCMAHIRDVRKIMKNTETCFNPLKDIVLLLKNYNINMESSYIGKENVIIFLEKVPFRWDNIVNKTFKKKEMIQPLQNQFIENLRIELIDFNKTIHTFYTEFTNKMPFSLLNIQNYLNLNDTNHFNTIIKRDLNYSKITNGFSLQDAISFVYMILDQYELQLYQMELESYRFNELEELFELGISKFEILITSRSELNMLKNVWDTVSILQYTCNSWLTILWNDIETNILMNEIHKMQNQLKNLPILSKNWPIFKLMEELIKNYSIVLPLIHELHAPVMRERHWKSLMILTRKNFEINNTSFYFEDIIKLELYRYANEVNEIIEIANKENKIERQLQDMYEIWKNLSLEFITYKRDNNNNNNNTEIIMFKDTDYILNCLEDSQLKLQNIESMGKFIDYFKDKVEYWEQQLGNVENILKLWIFVQKQWKSLESIFMESKDIHNQLPKETESFNLIDINLQILYNETKLNSNVLYICNKDKKKEMILQDMQLKLENCQKALMNYLKIKKNIFPRFYFVSNVALLDILSNGNNIIKLIPHLSDCFDGLKTISYQIDNMNIITSMTSKDNENVLFTTNHQPFIISGPVEYWLNEFLYYIQKILLNEMNRSLETASLWDIEIPRNIWLFDYPAQIVLVSSQIIWTEEVEKALEEIENGSDESAIKKYYEECSTRLNILIKLVQGKLNDNDRTKIISLITLDVHARDIIQILINKKVISTIDFIWQSQLRYYFNNNIAKNNNNNDKNTRKESFLNSSTEDTNIEKENKSKINDLMNGTNVNIRICDYKTSYCYEYTGNSGRLVITPLTDRCYVTLTTALRLGLGGAPAGPAGTGKTETTKDLAKALGVPCYVFNCSDQMNYETMGDIFQGLAQTGAWGCFDEFNRIFIEVLSVVATQVKSILDALAFLSINQNREPLYQNIPFDSMTIIGTFHFPGVLTPISLVPTVGIFITMNPGYAGRTELPENLKSLFRPCAMIRPDLQPICENMLMAEGFLKARSLANKFVVLYNLCQEFLSKQKHYDWGLRAVKSVLRVAGSLKRLTSGNTNDNNNMDEDILLMKALKDFNMPKIPLKDTTIFLSLLNDVFSGITLNNNESILEKNMKQDIIQICTKNGLQPDEIFIKKVIQYHELLQVRHSVMILGPPASGKTTVWQTLVDVHNIKDSIKPKTVYETINPKVLSSDELYGFITLTKDWKDGVLSNIMRSMSKEWNPYHLNQTYKWIILDGDIDAIWIESMNTVMDDNKMLTLVSNERILLSESMRMIFEIYSLKNATPATVSRAGILYINETDIGWQNYVDSWLMKRNSTKEYSLLSTLFHKYIDILIQSIHLHKISFIIPLTMMCMITTLCRLLNGLLLVQINENNKNPELIENIFIFSLIWSFGGALDSETKINDYRKTFSNLFKSLFKNNKFTDHNGLIFDLYLNIEKNEICLWQDMHLNNKTMGNPFHIATNHTEMNMPYLMDQSIMIPTIESSRLTYLLHIISSQKQPVMLVGSYGTGKTMIIQNYVHKISETSYSFLNINMNYYMDAKTLQEELEQTLEKRSGKNYGPLNNKKMIYFIDDFNMPLVEEYGTQTPMALIRQYMDYKGWYDRNDFTIGKKIINDIHFITCMNPKSGSYTINPRLQRHFSTFSCVLPNKNELYTMYEPIMYQHLSFFPNEQIKKLSSPVCKALIDLYQEVTDSFLPTTKKFHYIFNMRDISTIIHNILLSKPEQYINTIKIARLWLHESRRVFSDRLTSINEIIRFNEMATAISKKYFEEDQQEIQREPLIFSNFELTNINYIDTNYQEIDGPIYNSIHDKEELKLFIEKKLINYNENYPIMKLVLFNEAIEHIIRIARILMNPKGNALIIGVGGSGKQSLSKLAIFICNYQLIELSLSIQYTLVEFKENIKEIYKKAGIKSTIPLVLLLTDNHIVDERFLVYINAILSSGSIPDLFTNEEYEGIFNSLRTEAKIYGILDGKDQMKNFFFNRIRSNLHIILAFSPVGDTLRIRARHFPAIINCTTIDWFHPWSKDALVNVSQRFLSEETTFIQLSNSFIENISHHMADVHLSVTEASIHYKLKENRYNYVTPICFLELIILYQNLLEKKKMIQNQLIDRLDIGLTKLSKTSEEVDKLKIDLEKKLKKVEEKKKSTDELLNQMGKQRNEVQKKQSIVDIEKVKAESAALKANQIEKAASSELAIAKPTLEASKEAVNCLNKSSLTELKSMTKPPAGVEKVTTAVLMMIKNETKDFSWDNAKKMMAKVDAFKATLEHYHGETITEDIVNRVDPIIADPNFTYEKMKSKSVAAANLCVWVINTIAYHKIYVKVKPLMDALGSAKIEKEKTDTELAFVENIVAEVESQLAKLQASFREATNEKAKLEAEAQLCQERLSLAERLVNGLSAEYERWGKEIDILKQKEITLTGDILIGASFISYAGAFNKDFREELWKKRWIPDLLNREIPISNFQTQEGLTSLLTDDISISQWISSGLPTDPISIENACIIANCKRWPLIIDPQQQGVKWLKQKELDNKHTVIVVQTSQIGWLKKIEKAINDGSCVIIENLGETMNSSLQPLLSRQIYKKSRASYIRLINKEIEYNLSFKLYLSTNLNNPHYQPEIAAQCTIINFIVTKSGLEKQLLEKIVIREQPDLEKEKKAIQLAFNEYKNQLIELENQILERLTNAPEDILSDVQLIEGLEAIKGKANDIGIAVLKAKDTEMNINAARDIYQPISSEASSLFFLLIQLSSLNHMYQFSLDSFFSIFFYAMEKLPYNEIEDIDLKKRVENLQQGIRIIIFKMVSRGLFEDHKLVFLTNLTFMLLKNYSTGLESGYSPKYLNFLLTNKKITEEKSPISWLPDVQWQNIQSLIELDGFERFASDLNESGPRFREWFNTTCPENEKLPLGWRELDKTPFLKLLIIRTLRPDRITIAISNFIGNILPNGLQYTNMDSELNSYQILDETFKQSTHNRPIYIILSSGVDIMVDIDKLANKNNKIKGLNYHTISLGQGQDIIAKNILVKGYEEGHWIVLNNIHLMPHWLLELEKILDEFSINHTINNSNSTSISSTFRLFISSDSSPSIPISILNRSIKLVSEPPSGIKANLKRCISNFSKLEYEEMESRTRGILFGICYFHSILLERKKFGPVGFNMIYPFSTTDLISTSILLKNYMEISTSNIPWQDLKYLFGEIMYGGHIVNEFDRIICISYLDYFMRDELLDELFMFPYLDDPLNHSINSSINGSDPIHINNTINNFKAPKINLTYDKLVDQIDHFMPRENASFYGLHPNTEIKYRTEMGDTLLSTIFELQPKENQLINVSNDHLQINVESILQDILETYRDIRFDINENENILNQLNNKGPFQHVFLQECERMNLLLDEITNSLIELDLGFRGDIIMTESMDKMYESLAIDRVPKTWEKLAYPSNRSLGSWLNDLQNRINQLQEWITTPDEIPFLVWLPGLFNPQSFITAVLQSTAQKNKLQLDKLVIITEITKRTAESIDAPSRDGYFITGLYLEGARWDINNNIIETSHSKEMYCPMPIINFRSILYDRKDQKNIFECPVYKTQQRGNTYVFTAQLKTKAPVSKWILAGAALLMEVT